MNQKKSSKELLNGDQREDEWSKVTRGERYIIRTASQETNGVYSMLEIIADPRNGVPMHVHDNEEEHFIVLEGKVLIANGDSRAEVGAGSSVTIGRGVPHAWCNLFRRRSAPHAGGLQPRRTRRTVPTDEPQVPEARTSMMIRRRWNLSSIWYGQDDVLSPRSHAEWLIAKIPGAERREMNGGHMFSEDYLSEILRWVTA